MKKKLLKLLKLLFIKSYSYTIAEIFCISVVGFIMLSIIKMFI